MQEDFIPVLEGCLMSEFGSSDVNTFLSQVRSSFSILIASDDRFTTDHLVESLQPFGYKITISNNGREALAVAYKQNPDLIVADVELPQVDGFQFCRMLKRNPASNLIPVILLTSTSDRDQRVRGLQVGADDFITKPPDDIELRARVRSLLRIKTLNQRLHNEKTRLEIRLRERTDELEQLTLGLVAALEKANALNDVDTGAHIKRVCAVSELLAHTIGLQPQTAEKIRRFASLHDIGKVGVPDSILKKQGKLTAEEWEEMKRHTIYGYELLQTANADPIAQNIAYCHHERFDGSGYPQNLKGRKIPVEARIVALADVYDALLTKRCYKEAFPEKVAIDIIMRDSGKHFDPDLVQAFRMRVEDIREIRKRYTSPEELF